MKRVMIILCVAMFALWGCKGKKERLMSEGKVTENGTVTETGGDDSVWYADIPEDDDIIFKRGFGYMEFTFVTPNNFGYSRIDRKRDYQGFTSIEPIVNIFLRCYTDNCSDLMVSNLTTKGKPLPIVKDNESLNGYLVNGIELADGENIIEGVMDCNPKGCSLEDGKFRNRIIVIYNPTIDFQGQVRFSPEGASEDMPEDILVTVAISLETIPDKDSVKFVYESNGGFNGGFKDIATLNDEGRDGDEKALDGVYSVNINTSGLKEGLHYYRVRASFENKNNYTAPASIRIATANLSEKLAQDFALAKSIFDKYFRWVDEGSTVEEVVKYRKWVLSQIKGTPGIVSAGVVGNGTFFISFKHMKNHMILPPSMFRLIDYPPELNQNEGSGIESTQTQAQHDSENNQFSYQTPIGNPLIKNINPENEKKMIWSNNVISLSPFYGLFGLLDSYEAIIPLLNKIVEPKFSIVSFKNSGANVDTFKNIDKHGIVIIDTHGGESYDGAHIFVTGQVVDEDNITHQKDIDADVLTTIQSQGLKDFPFESQHYAIVMQPFMEKYFGNFQNSLVYISACESLKHTDGLMDDMQALVDNKSVGAIIGYSDTVTPVYSSLVSKKLFGYLLDGYTVKESVNKAYKDVSTVWNKPYSRDIKLLYRGNPDLKIVDNGLKNGGFEEMEEIRDDDGYVKCSILKGWTFIGRESPCMTSISVDNKLGPHDYDYSPLIEGQKIVNMDTDFGTSFYQKFKLPTDAKTISLSYKYLSSYLFGFSGREFCYKKDFRVTLTDTAGNVINILSHDFSDILSFNVDWEFDLSAISGCFSGNCSRRITSTSWRTHQVPVSSFAGKEVELRFAATDSYTDISKYDLCQTRVYLDNITIQ